MNPQVLQQAFRQRDIVTFSEQILGIPLHDGQKFWMRNSWKLINILSPSNQWGKTTAEAICHIFQAVCKPQLDAFNVDFDTWYQMRYLTLNFGKTYEVAKGVMESIIDITEGRFLLPNGTFNKSMLAGWAITDTWDMPKPPKIIWFNNSETLIRSYDGLGEAFKRLRLAFMSGDECGDIPEMQLFLNGTLLPRGAFFKAPIHLVGTAQPKGVEYEEVKEIAERDMKANGSDSSYFLLSANTNPEMASIYQNEFMAADNIRAIENIADPELRKQIIYGQYVDYSDHLYTWDEISQLFTDDIPYDPESGMSEAPVDGGYYIFFTDLAAAKDETSITCIRYNIIKSKDEVTGKIEYAPHRVVFHKAWKGETLPLSLQYALIKEYFMKYKRISPKRTTFGYDAGSLGGKNAEEAFKELHGVPFPPRGRSYAEIKGEMFGKIKEVLGRGRSFMINEKGERVDKNKSWGGVKASSKLKELRRQLEAASKDDDKLKNDQFTSFGMCIHFIEARAPKVVHTRAVDLNYNRTTL